MIEIKKQTSNGAAWCPEPDATIDDLGRGVFLIRIPVGPEVTITEARENFGNLFLRVDGQEPSQLRYADYDRPNPTAIGFVSLHASF